MLGLRTAPKEDLNCSSAELVYGKTLRLPGEFFDQQTKYTDQSDYIKELRETFKLIRPTQTSCHGNKQGKSFPTLLTTCDFIFIHNDAHRSPFQKVYDGPYRVIERKDKYFVVEKNGKKNSISFDKLKPAYVTKDTPLPFVRRGRPPGARRLGGSTVAAYHTLHSKMHSCNVVTLYRTTYRVRVYIIDMNKESTHAYVRASTCIYNHVITISTQVNKSCCSLLLYVIY